MLCLAYSDDQQNERGRAAYARRRCPSVVRVAAAQPPHVFGGGGDESPLLPPDPSPPLPSSLFRGRKKKRLPLVAKTRGARGSGNGWCDQRR